MAGVHCKKSQIIASSPKRPMKRPHSHHPRLMMLKTPTPFAPAVRGRAHLPPRSQHRFPRGLKSPTTLTSRLDIHKRNNDASRRADDEEEREAEPVVVRVVDECLDDVGTYD